MGGCLDGWTNAWPALYWSMIGLMIIGFMVWWTATERKDIGMESDWVKGDILYFYISSFNIFYTIEIIIIKLNLFTQFKYNYFYGIENMEGWNVKIEILSFLKCLWELLDKIPPKYN